MIISHKKKFIFIHIYKTAGTSITSAMIKYGRCRERLAGDFFISRKAIGLVNRIFNLYDDGNAWVNGLHKHSTAREIKEYCGSDIFDHYYKFAFVRNPWDWQVSLYKYIQGSNVHKDHEVSNHLSFSEFLDRQIEFSPPSQLDFLTDLDENILVNKIGRFECLSNDFDSILKELELSEEVSLPFKNSSARSKDYRSYYDEKTYNVVKEYFKKDIDFFDYSFEP